jgi:hypothetical protein
MKASLVMDVDDINFYVFFFLNLPSGKKRHEISYIVAHKTPIKIVWNVGLMLRTFHNPLKKIISAFRDAIV